MSGPRSVSRSSTEFWRKIQEQIEHLRERASDVAEIKPYEIPPDTRNEAVIFLKPELVSDKNVKLESVLKLVQKTLSQHAVEVVAAAVQSGTYLASHNIIPRHYGAINKVSREGRNALTPTADRKLKSAFSEQLKAGAEVLGGHQFINKHPYFTATALSVLWDVKGAQSVKLAPGVYAVDFQVLEHRVIILNGFHPFQIEYYTAPRKAILAMIVRSRTPWSILRNNLIGSTDPSAADAGSIRNELLKNKRKWKIRDINKSLNGVHMSAGPVEGFFEIRRFFQSIADVEECSNFFCAYRQAGLDETKLDTLSANPTLGVGKKQIPLFDATEEMEMSEAISLLKRKLKQLS